MHSSRFKRFMAVVAPSAIALILALVLSGCGGDEEAQPKQSTKTAKGSLSVAESALATLAPDARLLVVQTAQTVTETSTPVWAYLFGSPETDKTYLVYVSDGESMGASEYGTAGLSAEEWEKVPDLSDWKIDSDRAYRTAAETATSTPTGYAMGLQTFVPESISETDTVGAFVWYISMDVGGQTARVVEVDAKTGELTSE